MGGKYEIYARYYDRRPDETGIEDHFNDSTDDEQTFREWYEYCYQHYEIITITIRK